LKARGKTVLVISHDDRYFGVADRIIKLDYGKIVAPTQSHSQLSETLLETS
jgi:putative ATP-binding cassette transporter